MEYLLRLSRNCVINPKAIEKIQFYNDSFNRKVVSITYRGKKSKEIDNFLEGSIEYSQLRGYVDSMVS